jgi:hypothetical protein
MYLKNFSGHPGARSDSCSTVAVETKLHTTTVFLDYVYVYDKKITNRLDQNKN